jgi:endoglucanase
MPGSIMGPRISRRSLLLTTAFALGAGAAHADAVLASADWAAYCARFVQRDGRVVDTGNGGISHSEGQGTGLLLAVAFDDRARFDRIWRWTADNLRVRGDALFAWRWLPDSPHDRTPDRNNATDGDLLVAWALTRASAKWYDARYVAEARRIAGDVRAKLVRRLGEQAVLLPGENGFVDGDRLTLNPSYWIYPALAVMNAIDPDPVWGELTAGGLHYLRAARFGGSRLPPDWFDIDGGAVVPSRHLAPRFGYDAARVPLYLAWAGLDREATVDAARRLWTADPAAAPPAWIDLRTGARSPESAPAGFMAIARLIDGGSPADFPPLEAGDDYYSASLNMLARLAYHETRLS